MSVRRPGPAQQLQNHHQMLTREKGVSIETHLSLFLTRMLFLATPFNVCGGGAAGFGPNAAGQHYLPCNSRWNGHTPQVRKQEVRTDRRDATRQVRVRTRKAVRGTQKAKTRRGLKAKICDRELIF